MSKLNRNNFKGLKLDKLNKYIELINEKLNVTLHESPSWQGSVSNLMKFLNENNYIQHEGLRINDKSISNFISRLNNFQNKNDNLNFLPINKMNKSKIPQLINNVSQLNQMRDQSYASLAENNINKKDLTKALNDMAFYRERMAAIQPTKKAKQNKYGNVGMDDLINVVAKLNQDVKQIRDAQSVVSANEWINRHGYNDLYEATGRDLDGDGTPEVVVQTKEGKKPVIVNGFTTVPSLFPYRNAYYKAYPSVDQRKEAHKQGINLRGFINNIYHPEFDETGRTVTNYAGESWQDFETKLKAAGIDEKHLIKPKKRSTYQAFVGKCISPIYQGIKYLNGVKLPFTLTQMATVIWNQFALLPAMVYVYGESVMNVNEDQWKNLRGKKAVKEAIEFIVHDYLINPVKIADFVPTACEMCNKSGLPVNPEHIPLVAKATIAIILQGINALPPNPSDFNKWFDANVQSQVQALQTSAIVEEPE